MGRHWGVGRKYKSLFTQHVRIAAVSARTPKATGRRCVHLTIQLGKGKRRPDPDAYWKVTLDALKACGLLVDDGPKWCELAPVEYERREMDGCVVTLEELPDE